MMDKCIVMQKGYAESLCSSMQGSLTHDYGKGGVKALVSHNRVATPYGDDGQPDYSKTYELGICVTVHKPSKRIVLNYCPFCGECINGLWLAAKQDAKEQS